MQRSKALHSGHEARYFCNMPERQEKAWNCLRPTDINMVQKIDKDVGERTTPDMYDLPIDTIHSPP